MKKMKLIILMLLFASSAFAQEVRKNVEAKKAPTQSQPLYNWEQNGEHQFKVNCFVTDDRDGDREVVDRTFTIAAKDGANFTENFCIKGSNHDLQIILAYEGEEGLFYLIVNDVDAQITAQNVTHTPDHMDVFLGTEEVGLIAQCNVVRPKSELSKTPQQFPRKK